MAKDRNESTATAPAPASQGGTGLSRIARGMELAVKEDYPILVQGEEALEVYQENMAGQAIDAFSGTIIKVPSQGATNWSIPTLNGEQAARELVGIVMGIARRRSFWINTTPSSVPPDCSSVDMEVGYGRRSPDEAEPTTMKCEECPMSKFGTAKKPDGTAGRGQACKEAKLLFLLMPGDIMPVVVKVPPASLKAVLQFQSRMPVAFSGAVCRFTLNSTKNKDGVAYSEIVPSYVGPLPKDQAQLVRRFALLLAGRLEKVADDAAKQNDASNVEGN